MSTRLRAIVWQTADGSRTIRDIYETDWTGYLILRTPLGSIRKYQPFLEFVEMALRDGCTVEIVTREERG